MFVVSYYVYIYKSYDSQKNPYKETDKDKPYIYLELVQEESKR